MTRRCSVMRMPVAAQRASIPVAFTAGVDFRAVIGSLPNTLFATRRSLRQIAAHQKRIQLFPARLAIVAFAAPNDAKSGPFVEAACRLVVLLDLEEDGAYAAACQVPEMGQEQVTGKSPAAIGGVNRDRQHLRFIPRHPRHRKAYGLSP